MSASFSSSEESCLPTTGSSAAERCFIIMAGLMLLFTGTAKLASVGGQARVLLEADPILAISNRIVFGTLGLIEVVLVGYLWFGQTRILQVVIATWLGCGFALYRVGLWWLGINRPCRCLGTAADWWPWLARHQELLLKSTIGCLVIGGGFLLLRRIAGTREASPRRSMLSGPRHAISE